MCFSVRDGKIPGSPASSPPRFPSADSPRAANRRRRFSRTLFSGLLTLLLTASPASGQDDRPPVLTPSRVFTGEGFSRVRGVQELPDGRVLVADQNEEALYRIDFDQQTRVMLGSRGQGPGEYQGPTGLHPFKGDSLLMVDIQNGRFAIVSPEGVIGRTEPLFSSNTSIPEASDRNGNRYWDGVVSTRREKRNNPGADQAGIVRYDPETDQVDTLAHLTIPGPPNPNAFPAWDDWAVGPNGRVAIVRNQDEYRVDWVEADGTLKQGTPPGDFRPLRVNNADQRALEEETAVVRRGSVRMGSEPAQRPPPPDVPRQFPPAKLGKIWVTFDGHAVVERHQHLDEKTPLFDLFDGDGMLVQSFRLPENREIVGTGPSGIFAVQEDELGLLWLELYTLPEM